MQLTTPPLGSATLWRQGWFDKHTPAMVPCCAVLVNPTLFINALWVMYTLVTQRVIVSCSPAQAQGRCASFLNVTATTSCALLAGQQHIPANSELRPTHGFRLLLQLLALSMSLYLAHMTFHFFITRQQTDSQDPHNAAAYVCMVSNVMILSPTAKFCTGSSSNVLQVSSRNTHVCPRDVKRTTSWWCFAARLWQRGDLRSLACCMMYRHV